MGLLLLQLLMQEIWFLRAESGSKLHLAIAGTSRLTVSGSNIGIGTSTPDRQLQVHESTSGTSTAKFYKQHYW